MKITFNDILSEDETPKSNRFMELIVKEMKEYFDNKYSGTNWVEAADWMSDNVHTPEKYREYVDNIKDISAQLEDYHKSFNRITLNDPRTLRVSIERYKELEKKYLDNLYNVAHLGNLFAPYNSKTNFIEKYGLNIKMLIDAWEKFNNEVYKPGKIEYGKTKSGINLEHGLPEGNYTNPVYYNSMYGSKKYMVFEDKNTGDFILGVNVDWDWNESGGSFDQLYYKRYGTKSELNKDLLMMEKNHFKSNLKGASVDLESNQIDELVAHLDKNPMSHYEEEAREDETTIYLTIFDYVERFANWDRSYSMSHNEVDTFVSYYIDYEGVISQFN